MRMLPRGLPRPGPAVLRGEVKANVSVGWTYPKRGPDLPEEGVGAADPVFAGCRGSVAWCLGAPRGTHSYQGQTIFAQRLWARPV